MSCTKHLTLIAAFALLAGESAKAQSTMTVRPESRVVLLGRSNVHNWSCSTSTFQTSIGVDSSDRAERVGTSESHPIRLTVIVPVKSLNCGKARMNQDMFRALKADSFPEIKYVLTSYVVKDQRAATDSFAVESVGELTVAGRTQRVDIEVRGAPDDSGGFRGDGGVALLMTDFGIKPPTAFLGAIRTKNALEVRVEVSVTQRAIAATP